MAINKKTNKICKTKKRKRKIVVMGSPSGNYIKQKDGSWIKEKKKRKRKKN